MTVEQFAYLRSPDKIRAAIINAGGRPLSLDTIQRRLGTMSRCVIRADVGEPIESDGIDFRVTGLVRARKPTPARQRNRQSLARIEVAAKCVGQAPRPALRYLGEKPTIGSTPFSDALIEEVCEALGVSQELLFGPRRWWRLSAIRSLIVVLLRERSTAVYSYPRIARILGRHDHTTIMHSYRRFEHFCTLYPDVAALYLEMREGGK